MDPSRMRRVVDFFNKKITKDQFRSQDPEYFELQYFEEQLMQALNETDNDAVEAWLIMSEVIGYSRRISETVRVLALADWHFWHEGMVDLMAELLDPAAVPVLEELALRKFEYRDYDDYSSLGVRCVRALYHLRTRTALDSLRRLSQSSDEFVAQKAREKAAQLDVRLAAFVSTRRR